jgi:hypothetical protein
MYILKSHPTYVYIYIYHMTIRRYRTYIYVALLFNICVLNNNIEGASCMANNEKKNKNEGSSVLGLV